METIVYYKVQTKNQNGIWIDACPGGGSPIWISEEDARSYKDDLILSGILYIRVIQITETDLG